MSIRVNKENPVINQFICGFLFKSFLLIKTELKKNWIPFSLPIPFLIFGWIFFVIKGERSFEPGITGVSIYLVSLFFLALVYGLQCFSSEADQKTLDFLLTKPISPVLLLSVKYFLSLIIYGCWLLLSKTLFVINLAQLGLPQEMSFEWILLIVLMVHGMSCFAGLLAKGLERLLAIFVITTGVAGLSYLLWWRFFKLLQANYYLPDIPPNLNMFVMNILPVIFSGIGMAIPFIGTLWLMKNRIKLWRFKPAWWGIGIWVFAFFSLFLSETIFGPVLWPDKNAKYGDWHETTGILLAGPQNSKFEFSNLTLKNQKSVWNLSLSNPGRHSRIIYRGYNLFKPKFSPDGRKIVFSEDGIIKILDLPSNRTEKIGPGKVAGWSQDGQKLICAREIGKQSLCKLFIYDVLSKAKNYIPGSYSAVDLVWDSTNNRVIIFEYKTDLKLLNLKNFQQSTIAFENKNLFPFSIFSPSAVIYSPLNRVYFGQVLGRRLLYYFVDLKTNKILIDEEKMDFRIKSSAPLLIRSTPTVLLWPRIDGGFVYQTTNLNIGLHHHHSKNEDHDDDE